MKLLVKYAKTIGVFVGGILILSLIFSILGYFNLLGSGLKSIMAIIIMILFFLFIGYKYGQNTEQKGYLEGIKIGFLLIITLVLINLLFYQTGFSFERFIYYIVLILSSVFGSMLGINKKKKN